MNRPTLIGTLVFLAIGLGTLAAAALAVRAALAHRQARAEHAGWPAVAGTVVDYSETRNPQGEPVYRSVVEWAGPDGAKHRYTTFPARAYELTRGQTVALHYDPSNPAHVDATDLGESWILPAILGLLGLGFTGVAVRVMLGARGSGERLAG